MLNVDVFDTFLQMSFFVSFFLGQIPIPKIKHLILFSDRFRLFFFHFSIVMCFYVTKSVTLTCCAPLILMGARYYYSRKVIQSYLDCALHTDMADIEAYYMTPTGKKTQCVTVMMDVCLIGHFDSAPPPGSSMVQYQTIFEVLL